jgi:tetratricopeptide (TPR) repeat protein
MQGSTVMRQSGAETLVTEEPYALIAHVRVCGGAGWVTTGSTRRVAGLGIYRLLDGRPLEALPYFDRAFRLSPRDPQRAIWHLWVGLAYVMLGDDLNALEESKRSAAANPQYSPAFALQVNALALLGREAEARAALAVLQQLQPDLTITRNKEDRGYRVANPEFHRLIERYLDGLRKAGLPE